jgi:hypothetical protein
MARGGRRPGTGRPKGSFKQQPMLTTLRMAAAEVREKLAANPKRDPLLVMEEWGYNENMPIAIRFACMKEIADRIHPRLSAVMLDARHTNSFSNLTTEELHRELAELHAKRQAIEDARAIEATFTEADVVAIDVPDGDAAPEPDEPMDGLSPAADNAR